MAASVNLPEGYQLDASASSPNLPTGYQLDKPVGMPESFGRGAANNFPLAPQAIAAVEPGQYSQNLSDWNQKAGAAKAANPITYGAGAVTGALAPLAIPGVGEALEASPIAANAALGAANAVSNTDLLKNPGQALKQGAEGAVTGGALGGVANKLLPGAGAAEALENKASTQAVKTLGLRPGMLAHLEPEELQDLGSFARDADLVNGDTTSRLAKATDLKQQIGAQIGEMGAGQTPTGDLTDFITPLQEKMEKSARFFGPEGNADLNTYRQGVANIQNNGKTFDGLQELKTAYGEKAFDANHQVRDQAAADVYGKIKDAMMHTIKSSPAEYQDSLTGYKHLSDITQGLTKQLGVERGGGSGGGGFGMMGAIRKLPGAVRAPVGAAAMAMGHPILAAAAAMPEAANPALHAAVLSGTAKALPYLKSGTEQELNDYLTSQFGGQNAQR